MTKGDLPDSDSVVVLYIGGEGRSGSTVLAALLGNRDGFFPVGEFRGMWEALRTDELCGCGESISSCEFWRRVGERGFGGWDRIDVEAMLAMDNRLARQRHIPRLLMSLSPYGKSAELNRYRQILARLYATVKEVSGCSVIVDSTKDPAYALLLRGVPGLDVRFIHLVRDSRGVAYSWGKKQVERPEYGQHPVLRNTFMNTRSSWKAALWWDAKNVLFQFAAISARYRLVTYESLMSEPVQELAHLSQFVGEDRIAPGETTQPCQTFEYLPFHTLGGNRVRFERGQIRLHADEEWKTKMRPSQRLVVSTLTIPLLIAYGYVGFSMKHWRSG